VHAARRTSLSRLGARALERRTPNACARGRRGEPLVLQRQRQQQRGGGGARASGGGGGAQRSGAMAAEANPFWVLGLPVNAAREDVKEAFRRLCLQWHPDRCVGLAAAPPTSRFSGGAPPRSARRRSRPRAFHSPPPFLCSCDAAVRPAAEVRFKEVKAAYEAILKDAAGYTPPPPGTPPHVKYATAFWEAQTRDGRVPWGKFAGYQTEMGYYTAALRRSKSSVALLTGAGLIGIPLAAVFISSLRAEGEGVWGRMRDEGLDTFKGARYRVNGVDTPDSPFAPQGDRRASYVHKHAEFKHLRETAWQKDA